MAEQFHHDNTTTIAGPLVWLSYVSYPVTTAVYFERALRKKCRVTTVGPKLPPELIQGWQLEKMKLPVIAQDIPTTFTPDMLRLLDETNVSLHPDIYLWVESVGGHYPQNLDALQCPKVCYLIDSHLNLEMHLQWAIKFDFVFIAQREYLDDFRRLGINTYWLPLGCDPEVHAGHGEQKIHEIGFVGGVMPTSRRGQLLGQLAAQIPVYYERCFWDDMSRVFAQSKMIFNNAVKSDLNMRVFEVMSTGTLLLTDLAQNSGQDVLFADGEDCAVYHDHDLLETASFYLRNPQLCEQIAARGQKLVHNAHTYAHRVDDLLNVVINGKPSTFSAEEMREQSLKGVRDNYEQARAGACFSREKRSFVIPVLDYSPASEYNITGLLQDLEEIAGDVIVIFNSEEVAEQIKRHPRITAYAIMKKNVGVARAWNLGLNIATTPTVFILNADVHLEPATVETLENALYKLDSAACVGPQGSFFDFRFTQDYMYFDKGSFHQPLVVDAVSGFLFAVKLEHFDNKLLKFENAFTPCYFEEWDLGLQIKRAGLKAYIVPTTAYDHHWSGSIRAYRQIEFYDRAETAGEILDRNRATFMHKWRSIARKENIQHILESDLKPSGKAYASSLLQEQKFAEADLLFAELLKVYPHDAEIASFKRFTSFQLAKIHDAEYSS